MYSSLDLEGVGDTLREVIAQPVEHLPVSVVIASWRRPHELKRCLYALRPQLADRDEVLVVARHEDSATQAAVAEVQAELAGLQLVHVERPGVVAAMDLGLKTAANPIVTFTDDDTVARDGWLLRIREHFARDPRVGGVGGRDWIHYEGRLDDASAEPVGTVVWFGRVVGNHHRGAGAARFVHILKGANMSFRREALLPGLDRLLWGESSQAHHEVRTSLEVWRRGWELLYDPGAAVDHYIAPRPGDERGWSSDRSARDIAEAAHNQLYGLLAGLRGWRRATAALYQLAFGTRENPGPILGLERALRGEGSEAIERTRTATAGRLAAFRTLRRLRRSRQPASA